MVVLGTAVADEEAAKVRALAEVADRTVSWWLRRLIQAELARLERTSGEGSA